MPLVLLPRKGDELVQEGVDGSPSPWGLQLLPRKKPAIG